MTMRRLSVLLAATAATAVAAAAAPVAALPAAAAATPKPFGHECTPQNGVRFCPTVDKSQRVRSFDGVPLDVDVTLPAEGDGPFPTIVMLHGWGGNKNSYQQTKPEGDNPANQALYHWNPVHFAQQGYAVVTPTARGWGRSCGEDTDRGGGCENGGWIQLADHRAEIRDVQHLLGLLADEGVTDPGRIGTTGISYGGGQSLSLAFLNDRIRNEDGSFAPWTSPKGTPLRIAAAYPRWLWSDLVYSLLPNGRFLDFRAPTATESRDPIGVPIQSYITGLFAVGNASGFIAPPGLDPGADLTSWYARVSAGEPYGSDARAIADEIFNHHQGFGLPLVKVPPLLLQDGWTDDLFTPAEALRIYNLLRSADPSAQVSLQFGDLGHARGQNKPPVDRFFNDQGSAFFDRHLRGRDSADAPAPGSVHTFTQTCPKDAPAAGPFSAASWDQLHPGVVRFESKDPQAISSTAGDPQTARTLDPVAGGGACAQVAHRRDPGTALYELPAASGWTLLGRPTITAKVAVTGTDGQIAARLWNRAPDGTRILVTRGVYRLRGNEEITFQLNGNGWRFEKGHVPQLELLGRDAPYYRPSNGAFTVTVSDLRLELPTLERADGGQIANPRPARIRTVDATGRPRPRLALKVTPRRDRRGARRFTVSGRLLRPASVGAADACRGRVSAQWKAGRRTISTRRATVRRDCRFRLAVTFRAPRRFAGRRSLKVTVRYLGSRSLAPVTARPRRVRVQ